MSRYHSYLSSATAILQSYDGAEPFVHFSRKFFAANKKFGSRDRKVIAALCYNYFRCYYLFAEKSVADRILFAVFLCQFEPSDMLAAVAPDLNKDIHLPAQDKLKLLNKNFLAILPQLSQVSSRLHSEYFSLSLLRQPHLYLRTRPGKKEAVLQKLEHAHLPFTQLGDDCVVLKNATSLQAVIKINREALVQDFNSQRVFDFLSNEYCVRMKQNAISAWDCCAASGGKSILLYDRMNSRVQLTVSDIRKSILHNLQERLQAAGVPIYKAFEADLLKGPPSQIHDQFDLIICDAPCTGSGTWSRTPEQLAFFKTEMIDNYSARQTTIAGNAVSLLKKNGLFFYVTYSVFEKENEQVVSKLSKLHGLTLLDERYYEGYEMQADTLFVAVLTK